MKKVPAMKKILALAIAAIASTLFATEAQAQVRRCLVTAQSTPAVANYDPFNPSALNINNVSITFTRSNGSGGAKPSRIDMYVQAPDSTANGTQLIPVSVVGSGNATGLNQNIFYDNPGATPNITVPLGNTPALGVLRWDYTGNDAASDVFTVNFNVVLPANLDLTASTQLVFNIEYGCNGTGGGPPFSERATAPNAFTISINVLSALQASFAGPALDFGEVGDLADADIPAAPNTRKVREGIINVGSSGVYDVSMVSQNGYRMTYPGGNVALEAQNLRYQTTFLGQTRSPADTSAITQTCQRAGIGSPVPGAAQSLELEVQLLEGGSEEDPAPNYQDILEVTFTPRATGTTGGAVCS
jgi:hypothetical protein